MVIAIERRAGLEEKECQTSIKIIFPRGPSVVIAIK